MKLPKENAQPVEEEEKGVSNSSLRLSATRFKTFETCPKLWAFENIVYPDHELRNEAAMIGTAIHAAIEEAARFRYEFDQIPQEVYPEELIELFEVWLVENAQPLSVAAKVDAISVILNLGKLDLGGQVVEPEHEWIMDLEGVPQEVRGTWDLCTAIETKHDSMVIVQDWKTGRYPPTQDEFDNDRQVGLYLTAAREKFPQADHVVARFHWIREGVTLQTPWTPAMDRYQRASVKGIARLMLKGYDEPVVGDHCKLCDFRLECPAFVEEMKEEIDPESLAIEDAKNAELLEERYRVAQRIKLLGKYKEDLDRVLAGAMDRRGIPMIKLNGHSASFTRRKNKVIDGGRARELAEQLGVSPDLLLEKCATISVTKARAMIKSEADRDILDDYTRTVTNQYLTVRRSRK